MTSASDLLRALAGALLLATSVAAIAQPAGNPPPRGEGGGRRGPPPEAVAACNGKAEGAQVSFALRDGKTASGTCAKMPDGQLAARPSDMPPPPPPQLQR